MIRIFSVGIRSIPHLEAFLDSAVGFGLSAESEETVEAVAGWGVRSSACKAIRYAKQLQLPYLALEDGFLRSVGLGQDDPPLSIVVDDLGIYYDASRASRLELLVGEVLSPSQVMRARTLIASWREARVSKYNHLREYAPRELPASTTGTFCSGRECGREKAVNARYVLVVDQTRGDASIRFGMADHASFQRMLEAALDENPECTVLLKIHPDVCAGKKRGHFDLSALSCNPRVRVVAEDVHPVGLVEHAEAVYTVTSQVGFEGLLWDKPVHTFGMPFYAGWGLTQDELPAPVRRRPCTIEQMVHAALVAYPRYVHPETGSACEAEEVLAYLGLQRQMRQRFPPEVQALGFSLYKRRAVSRFFAGSKVRFARHRRDSSATSTLAVWGCNDKPVPSCGSSIAAAQDASEVIHLEDGFLRSVGLGAELIRPLSWVMDRRGIYYDASRPSDLELLLQTYEFDRQLCSRAALLRSRIVAGGLTKYNVGRGRRQSPAVGPECRVGIERSRNEKKVILVPGQVESDASIRYGASVLSGNMELLQAVRNANPEAYIVYKPHPDVESGLRARGKDENDARFICDEVVNDISMHELLGEVDEVHVLTSLAGFEALLRGKRVVTYGQPFYSGWGLTHDMALTPAVAQRRTRTLTLDELVAGVLILYPTYVSRATGRFTTPERVLDELLIWREQGLNLSPLWRLPLRWVLRIWGRRR